MSKEFIDLRDFTKSLHSGDIVRAKDDYYRVLAASDGGACFQRLTDFEVGQTRQQARGREWFRDLNDSGVAA